MRTQAYHGGDKYTGVDKVLMEKSDDIMTDIHQYLQQELDHPLKEAIYGETFDICDLIKRLLRLLDILFSIPKESRRGNSRGPHTKRRQSAALLWQKLDQLTHLASIISTRKLRVS
jgi:hypothetical protein